MDNLKVDVQDYDIRNQLGWIEVSIILKVNDKVLPNLLRIRQLLNAFQFSGRYPLFTTGDGVFDAYFVDVVCTTHAWVIKNRFHSSSEELLETFEYRISWQQVKDELLGVKSKLHNIHKKAPHLPMHEGVLGDPVDTMPSEDEYQFALKLIETRIKNKSR